MRDQVQDDLAVAGGLKDGALPFETLADIGGVHQVAVVRQRDASLIALHPDRLGVQQRGVTRGGIARVADGEPARHTRQRLIVENIGHQAHVLVQKNPLAIR